MEAPSPYYMAKCYCFIPIAAAVLIALSAACCINAVRVTFDEGEYWRNFTECRKMLDERAPRCRDYVYFKKFLPPDHAQCCKNYLRMDEERHDCWDYLFDDPYNTMVMETNILRCKLELEPPVSRNNGTFLECKSDMNEKAPNCWEDVYYKHKLPENVYKQCCGNLVTMYDIEPPCLAYLFDNEKANHVLRRTVKECKG